MLYKIWNFNLSCYNMATFYKKFKYCYYKKEKNTIFAIINLNFKSLINSNIQKQKINLYFLGGIL